MALAANLEALSWANHNFTFSLFKEVAKAETGNIFFSPLCIHVIMFMVSVGAASKTFDEIIASINLDKNTHSPEAYRKFLDDIMVNNEHEYIKLVTGIFVDRAFNVKDSFVENSKKYFNSSTEKLDFKNDSEQQREYINNWIFNKTNNIIKDLFPSDTINRDTALVLANALHFKSSWQNYFKYNDTKDEFFYETPDNKVSVKMMELTHSLKYYHDSDLKFAALELPYASLDFKLMILLPDAKDGLKDLENNFSKINLHDISNEMRRNKVNVKLPRFKLEQSLDLKKTFSDLGCTTMFSKAANFSNMTVENNVFVSSFLHKAYISVDEYGTEAAAATGVSIVFRTGYNQHQYFFVDHPFIFFILSRSGSIIFVGRIAKIDSPA